MDYIMFHNGKKFLILSQFYIIMSVCNIIFRYDKR